MFFFKNNIFPIIFIIFFVIGCNFLETPKEPVKLKSDIENILINQKAKKIINYSYKPKEINGQVVKDTLIGFTESILEGLKIKSQSFDSNKNLSSYTIIEYNVNWNRLKESFISLDTIRYNVNRSYDANNNLVDECYVYNQSDLLNFCNKYKYDNKGLLNQEIQYDKSGKTQWKFDYKYDSIDRVKTIVQYDIDGQIWDTEYMTYDSRNNLIEKVTKSYKYDLFDSEINEYDERNNVIKITKYYGNSFIKNLLEEKRFEYEYDKNGNWIKFIEYKGVLPVYYYERIITY